MFNMTLDLKLPFKVSKLIRNEILNAIKFNLIYGT